MSIISLVNTGFILAVLGLNLLTHNPYKDLINIPCARVLSVNCKIQIHSVLYLDLKILDRQNCIKMSFKFLIQQIVARIKEDASGGNVHHL